MEYNAAGVIGFTSFILFLLFGFLAVHSYWFLYTARKKVAGWGSLMPFFIHAALALICGSISYLSLFVWGQ